MGPGGHLMYPIGLLMGPIVLQFGPSGLLNSANEFLLGPCGLLLDCYCVQMNTFGSQWIPIGS